MRILVTPERLHDLSGQLNGAASSLHELDGRLGRALNALDWEARSAANLEGRVNAARRQAQTLASEAERLARWLAERAQAFQQADQQGAEMLGATTQNYFASLPIPVPTPNGKPLTVSPQEIVKTLDDWLKPIDWIQDSRKASRVFDETLKNIGRLLNTLTGQRGHVKMMSQFGAFLKGSSQGVGFLSTVLDAREMHRYLAGELTNAQIAETVIKVLFPIPFANDHLANWLIQNMPDPNGHWRGLISTVE
jgi:uncharacterized protein YukE